jgi:hypothetical protein
MSQSLGDVLGKRSYAEPPEISQIKEFIMSELGVGSQVSITSDCFIIKVSSAAAAGLLRTKILQLQESLGTKKRIVIRIG